MSDSNDTSTIDKKKEQDLSSNSVKTYTSKVVGFVISVVVAILIVLLYFSGSSLILFMCKVAQSNILPSEPNCAPYTDTEPTINPSPIKTNIFTTFSDPEMSMKMEIPYDINSKNKLIEIFKDYKQKPSSNFLANYFISISESLLQFNYGAINLIMNLMNSTFPEPLVIGLGPIICGFLYVFGVLVNILYFIYLWFANMSWFFKTNTNDTGDGKPQWEDVTITTPVNWCLGVALAILFIFFLVGGFPIVSILPMVFFHNSIIASLFTKAIVGGKQITSLWVIKETLKYYKVTIVSIISIFVVLLAFSKLGSVPGVFSTLTLGLIYWGIINIDLFNPIKETNLSPSVSNNQAVKKCANVQKTQTKHGFFGFGQKGGGITKELKKLGKNITQII
jgi:FtsH-binding integral membrane protein